MSNLKKHYTWRMLVLYFKNDKSRFQEQRFSLEGIFFRRLLKSKNCKNLILAAKNDKSKTTLFSETFEHSENKVPLFLSFLASIRRYWRFVLLTSLNDWLISLLGKSLFLEAEFIIFMVRPRTILNSISGSVGWFQHKFQHEHFVV